MIEERPGQSRSLDKMEEFNNGRGVTNVFGARCSQVGDETKCILSTKTGWILVDELDGLDMEGEEGTITIDEPSFTSTDRTWDFDINAGSASAANRGAACHVIDHSRRTSATDKKKLKCEIM